MDIFMSKSFLSLLICLLLLYREVKSQSDCPIGGDFTNGVSAELIIDNDGVSLLGIRVLWTIKSEYLNCQFSYLRVQLNSGERGRDITVNDSSADFYNLDCNRQYTPKVRGTAGGIGISDIGNLVFFGSTITSAPSQVLRVCCGPKIANKQNISWDLLPCHLQNGADITGYIIQYNRTSGGEAQNISSSDSRMDCGVEPGGPYRCLLPSFLFTTEVTYSFQVAAVNRYGTGPFSGQVMSLIGSQDSNTSCVLSEKTKAVTTAATISTTVTVSTTVMVSETVTVSESVYTTTAFDSSTPQFTSAAVTFISVQHYGWVLIGSLNIAATVLARVAIK